MSCRGWVWGAPGPCRCCQPLGAPGARASVSGVCAPARVWAVQHHLGAWRGGSMGSQPSLVALRHTLGVLTPGLGGCASLGGSRFQ